MLYVGLDQHKRHLIICVRDEQGTIAWRRQVSTKWEEVDQLLALWRERAAAYGGYARRVVKLWFFELAVAG